MRAVAAMRASRIPIFSFKWICFSSLICFCTCHGRGVEEFFCSLEPKEGLIVAGFGRWG